jgi:hypothetical protein
MIDVAAAILAANGLWIRRFRYLALSGYPLIFACLGLLWTTECLPCTLYSWGSLEYLKLVVMIILVDALQTIVHCGAHTWFKRTILGKSHAVHHVHRDPRPEDAFYTGVVDALVQLVLPLVAVLHVVRPSKVTALVYGCGNSWWLTFLHSDPSVSYPRLERLRLVTPAHHHAHHVNPTRHFSTVLR